VTVSIRRADASDADALGALAARLFPLATTPRTGPDEIEAHVTVELSAARFRDFLGDPACEILVAEEAGVLAGYTMVVQGEPEDPNVRTSVVARPTTELSKFYVDPDHHGTGLAAMLMEATIAAARAGGATSLWLGVSDENPRANRFYEKHGFVIVGAKRFRIGDRFEDDHVRELRL